jgi:hypothetical protein
MSTEKEMAKAEEHHEQVGISQELANALREYTPGSPEEKKLVKKIDFFLMPMLWIMYILNYVDRMNIVSSREPSLYLCKCTHILITILSGQC